jgi:hypothetical protein
VREVESARGAGFITSFDCRDDGGVLELEEGGGAIIPEFDGKVLYMYIS